MCRLWIGIWSGSGLHARSLCVPRRVQESGAFDVSFLQPPSLALLPLPPLPPSFSFSPSRPCRCCRRRRRRRRVHLLEWHDCTHTCPTTTHYHSIPLNTTHNRLCSPTCWIRSCLRNCWAPPQWDTLAPAAPSMARRVVAPHLSSAVQRSWAILPAVPLFPRPPPHVLFERSLK